MNGWVDHPLVIVVLSLGALAIAVKAIGSVVASTNQAFRQTALWFRTKEGERIAAHAQVLITAAVGPIESKVGEILEAFTSGQTETSALAQDYRAARGDYDNWRTNHVDPTLAQHGERIAVLEGFHTSELGRDHGDRLTNLEERWEQSEAPSGD